MGEPDTPFLGVKDPLRGADPEAPPHASFCDPPSGVNNAGGSNVFSSDQWPPALLCPKVVIDYKEKDRDPLRGTFCLALYVGIWVISFAVTPIMVFCLATGRYAPATILFISVALCYVIPVRPHPKFRAFLRTYLGRYFQEASIRFEQVPDPDHQRPSIFCLTPHGIVSLTSAHLYLTEELNHVYFCFSTMLRLSPYFRLLSELIGHTSNVRKSTILYHMALRRSLALTPGAWHEATLHSHRKDRVYIKQRRGFIKYALQHNYTVTPSYSFGEKDTYCNLQGGYRFRFWLNSHGILAVVPWGRLLCPLLPRVVKHHTVVGCPIDLPHIPNPTVKHITYWHQVYIDRLVDIFDRYKVQFYGESARYIHLEVW